GRRGSTATCAPTRAPCGWRDDPRSRRSPGPGACCARAETPAEPARPRRHGRRRTGQERDAPARSVLLTSCRRSDGADLLGLRPLVALADIELHALPLVEGAVAVHVDLAVVHEDVCAASVDLDESVALFGVEPLDRALRHTCHLLCRPSTIARRDRGAATSRPPPERVAHWCEPYCCTEAP